MKKNKKKTSWKRRRNESFTMIRTARPPRAWQFESNSNAKNRWEPDSPFHSSFRSFPDGGGRLHHQGRCVVGHISREKKCFDIKKMLMSKICSTSMDRYLFCSIWIRLELPGPRGPGSSSRIQMLRFGVVFDRFRRHVRSFSVCFRFVFDRFRFVFGSF